MTKRQREREKKPEDKKKFCSNPILEIISDIWNAKKLLFNISLKKIDSTQKNL